MNIGFEATRTIDRRPTGISRYSHHLISALASENGGHNISIYYDLTTIGKITRWLNPGSVPRKVHYEGLLPLFNFPDVIHGLEGTVPDWKYSAKVVTVHDVFPIICNEDFVAPKEFRDKMRRIYKVGLSRADAIVTDSENTRRDVIDAFSVPESKVITVYPGNGLELDLDTPPVMQSVNGNGGRKFLLFLGAISGRKNTERIVRAYANSKAKDEFDLVMAGILSYRHELTLKAIRELGLENRVKMLGYVADDEVRKIFRNASGLVFPTLYEGFGFPILEAMMLRVPVLTSNVGSAAEVAGGHAKLTDPYDTEAVTAGIDYLLESSNFDLDAARKHAEGFTWKRCAKELLSVYEQL